MAKRPPTIPDSELDVLKVLWDLGQATVREALETLRSAGRQWSYATVATLLDRLESKGLVTSDRRELALHDSGRASLPASRFRFPSRLGRSLALPESRKLIEWRAARSSSARTG